MADDKRIVLALARAGKAGYPPFFPQGVKLFRPAGQEFMRIALVADIPDELILGGAEFPVHRHRNLHNPEIGGQMAAGFRHGFHQHITNFSAQIFQLRPGQCFHIIGRMDIFQIFCIGQRIRHRTASLSGKAVFRRESESQPKSPAIRRPIPPAACDR